MLKDLFSNRLFILVLAFFVLCVVGGSLYIWYVERTGVEKLADTPDRVKELMEKRQSTAEVPEGDTSPGGHWHGDEWHAEPHESLTLDTPEAKTVVPMLTAAELDALYHQIAAEISEMNSADELDMGLDLSKYSPKQLEHLQKVGIDLSRLPKKLQNKITDHQWRQKGLEPPPQGYTYIEKGRGSYFLHKEGDPFIELLTDDKGNVTGASFMGPPGGDPIEVMKEAAKRARSGNTSER